MMNLNESCGLVRIPEVQAVVRPGRLQQQRVGKPMVTRDSGVTSGTAKGTSKAFAALVSSVRRGVATQPMYSASSIRPVQQLPSGPSSTVGMTRRQTAVGNFVAGNSKE